jgi:hypothetical protein
MMVTDSMQEAGHLSIQFASWLGWGDPGEYRIFQEMYAASNVLINILMMFMMHFGHLKTCH